MKTSFFNDREFEIYESMKVSIEGFKNFNLTSIQLDLHPEESAFLIHRDGVNYILRFTVDSDCDGTTTFWSVGTIGEMFRDYKLDYHKAKIVRRSFSRAMELLYQLIK